jgi:succinyl-diaminopimelate desuccinylase
MQKNLLHTLKTLIAFETVTGNKKETEKALNWVRERALHIHEGLHIQEYCFDEYPALTIATQHTETPTVWLAAHIDVVPGPKDIFRPKEKDGRLFGRGAYDMKFAIACYLEVLETLGEKLPEYNFGIMITGDEEIGGWNGTQKLIEKGCGGDVCFLPDGGENWVLEEEVKGVWQVVFKSEGVSSHASRPWEGRNAIQELQGVLVEFLKEFEDNSDEQLHFHRTATLSNIVGGNGAINKVPDHATATLDIRFISNEEQRWLEKRLQETEVLHEGVTHQTRILVDGFSVDSNNAFIDAFKTCIPSGKGEGEIGKISHGSSDARFFANANIPTIVTRPLGGGAHSNKEWIDIADMEHFCIAIRKYIEKVAKK